MDENNINWYPGHMAKTRRLISDNLKLCDVVAEIIDARIPRSSRNPDLDALIGSKPRIIVLNKSDLADQSQNKEWLRYYNNKGCYAMLSDIKGKNTVSQFTALIQKAAKEKLERQKARGMIGKNVRVMVVGIPNVGKSTFINRLAGSKIAKAEDRPGVTRGKQWVSLGSGIELLDMPGILWPKIETAKQGEFLAFTGAVKDAVTDQEYLACKLLEFLNENYKAALTARYKLSDTENKAGHELLGMVAKKRGFIVSGGEADLERTAIMVVDEYRAAKIGAFTLEKAE